MLLFILGLFLIRISFKTFYIINNDIIYFILKFLLYFIIFHVICKVFYRY
nr:MAG TPA: hypothetical protein [Caudoviricetes sp.]